VIERFQSVPPIGIHPGERFAYNNAGYVLLAEALHRLSGRPIDQLSQERLFHPLGMTVSRLGGEPLQVRGQPDPPGTVGDGGLWTSVADLTTWLTALNDGALGAAAVRRAHATDRLNDGTRLDYAWGIRITATSSGPQITHGGTWAGWLAKTVRMPSRRIAVAVLSLGGTEQAVSDLGENLAMSLAH
jgi:CubicO group peptidase (beta-lactamase class C family)